MADSLRTQYEIELSIQGADRLNGQCAEIDRALEAISKNAKSLKFEDAAKGVEDLEKYMNGLLESEEDCTAQWAEFKRASTKAYKDLEKEAVKLNYSISDQGKLQRERLKELEQEKAALGSTKEEKARAREIDKEIKEIRKQVVDMSDEDIKAAQKANVQARSRLKIMQNEAKQQKTQAKEQKTLSKLIKEDLKPLRDKLKAQTDFIKSLKTTEGRYNAIKKAAKSAYNVGKSAMKGAGLVLGSVLAVTGATIAAAQGQVTKEEQARRVKAGDTYGQKSQLMKDVFLDVGGSDEEIVDAINRVYNVLGKDASLDEIRMATAMELKYPGLSKMFMQQNVGKVTARDFLAAGNHSRATQEFSGASKEQMQSASDYISNLRQNSFTNAGEMELRDLYLALQGSGGFDSDEELQRAFNHFVREQKRSNVDVFDLAKQWQQQGKWTRTAYGATNKTQAENAIKNIDFQMLATQQRITDYSTHESEAEKAARTAREVTLLKDELLLQLLKGLKPLLESGAFQKLIKMVFDMIESETFQKLLNSLSRLLDLILTVVQKIAEYVKPVGTKLADYVSETIDKTVNFFGGGDDTSVGVSGQSRANGGIAAMPSIFGEGVAPEIAIPLDPAREGRAQQLSAYVSNTFNMNGNETSAMALSSALNSREWAYQSARMGALQRRMGR